MYYRRMEPQPVLLDDRQPGVKEHWSGNFSYPPEDMSGAIPWKDRDGEWYWRRSLQ